MLIHLGRGMTPASSASSLVQNTIDSTVKTVALIGDSITAQNTSTNSKEYTSQGYMNWLNIMTGQRYYYQPTHNSSSSGAAITSISDDVTNLSSLSPVPDLVFYIPFANDIVGGRTYAELITDFDVIVDYVTNTLGAKLVVTTPLPRTQNDGSPLNATQVILVNQLKSYVLGLSNPMITSVNVYDNMVSSGNTPDLTKFKNESGKYLHPNPKGAHQIASDIKASLDPIFGSYDIPDMSICDLGLNSDLSGISGTESSALASGTIADDWRLYSYSGMTGTANKDINDKQALNLTYTDSRSFDLWELQATDITTGFTTGEQYYMEAEVEIISASNLRMICCVEPTLNNSGSYKAMAPNDSNSLPDGFMGTIHLRTPIFTISASDTSIDPIIWAQMNSLGVTSNSNIIVKQARFNKI